MKTNKKMSATVQNPLDFTKYVIKENTDSVNKLKSEIARALNISDVDSGF